MTSFFNTLQDSAGVYDSFSVRKSKLDIAIKKKYIDISKSVFMPEISLDTGIDYFDSNDTFSKSVDHLKHGNTYIQISVNYNLFSGFKDIATLKKSYLETQISQMTLSTEQEFFDINTNQLIQLCQKSLGEVRRSQKNLESMTILLDESYSQFNQNQISKSDIIETQLHQAELEFLYKKAAIEAEISLSNLAFQIGQGSFYLERFKIK